MIYVIKTDTNTNYSVKITKYSFKLSLGVKVMVSEKGVGVVCGILHFGIHGIESLDNVGLLLRIYDS
jgi:hypothetical protein